MSQPPPRAWSVAPTAQLPDGGVLVELGPARTSVVYELQHEIPPGPFRALLDFAQVSPGGAVRGRYTQAWSIDDELGVATCAVVGDELRCLVVRLDTFGSGRLEVTEERELAGLVLLEPGSSAAVEAIAAAEAAWSRVPRR